MSKTQLLLHSFPFIPELQLWPSPLPKLAEGIPSFFLCRILLFSEPRQKVRTLPTLGHSSILPSAPPGLSRRSQSMHAAVGQPCICCLTSSSWRYGKRLLKGYAVIASGSGLCCARWEILQDFASDSLLLSITAHFYFLGFKVGFISPKWGFYNRTGVLEFSIWPGKCWALTWCPQQIG